MTEADILAGVVAKERGLREAVQRPDGSWDPLTLDGITTPTLGAWRKLGRPATRAELLAMTPAERDALYRHRYIEAPGFTPDRVPFEPLRVLLIDYGVNSGPPRAIRYLQRVIGLVTPSVPVTGALDGATSAWLFAHAGYLPLVHDALVAARCRMVTGAVEAGRIRRADERGLVRRAASFVLARG